MISCRRHREQPAKASSSAAPNNVTKRGWLLGPEPVAVAAAGG